MIYFIVLNLAYNTMKSDRLIGDIEVFSGAFLVIGIYLLEKAYKNVVTAYQNGNIGTAAAVRTLEKPSAQKPSAQTAEQQAQQQTSATSATSAGSPETQSTGTNTSSTAAQQNSTAESASKTKSQTNNSEKYKATIAKLDYVLNFLNSVNNQSSGGTYGTYSGFSNPMMFNNPFVMPYSGGMYT